MTQSYYRYVVKIKATDSPNVRLALLQKAKGLPVTREVITEGVLTYDEYLHRLATWDEIRKCIGLDADFYLGAQLLLFPPDWLNYSERLADELRYSGKVRIAKSIGIDPAEGGDKTSMCAIDELGIIDLVSRKTPNTNDIPREAIAFGRKHNVPAHNWVFDRGGGGLQHADSLRASGFNVRTVSFGEALGLSPRRGRHQFPAKNEAYENRGAYLNRRVQMYWDLSGLVDMTRIAPKVPRDKPTNGEAMPELTQKINVATLLNSSPVFAIPSRFPTVRCEVHGEGCLRAQLAVMPKMYDKDGKCRLPPKDRVGKATPGQQAEKTLKELISHSPDEADSLVLAVHGLLHKTQRSMAGVA